MNQQVSDFYYFYPTAEDIQQLGIKVNHAGVSLVSAELTQEQAHSLIPSGDYCYKWLEKSNPENHHLGKVKTCPFYDKMQNLPAQSNGYCHYLKAGDFTKDGTFLLFDMCKCCGINILNE